MPRNILSKLLPLLLMIAITAGGFAILVQKQELPSQSNSALLFPEDHTIVIDPGHGGIDGGAVGVGGIEEKEINLALSLDLVQMLRVSGFAVIMTRETDVSIHDPGVSGAKAIKTSDLKNRLKLTQSAANPIFLSIHQNKYSSGSISGAQMFFGGKNPESARLAQLLQDSIRTRLQPENNRMIKEGGSNLFLIHTLECPAVLAECGFLSNAKEAELLSDPEYRQKVAFALVCGLLEFHLTPKSKEITEQKE